MFDMDIGLWEPDIFFNTKNEFSPSPPDLSKEILYFALNYYGIGAKSVSQSRGFEVNSTNFRVGDFLFKKIKNSTDVTVDQLKLYQYLHNHGIDTPEIIPNLDGEIISRQSNGSWIVMEYIDGDFFSASEAELIIVAGMLPKLFSLLVNYEHKDGDIPWRPYIQNYWKLDRDYGFLGEYVNSMISFSHEDIASISHDVLDALPILNSTASVVHIDLHPRNILYSHGKLYVLDFDSLLMQSVGIAYNFNVYKLLRRCIHDGIDIRRYYSWLFGNRDIQANYTAARAEILFRLVSILESCSEQNNLSIWSDLIPVHIRGLYESELILGGEL